MDAPMADANKPDLGIGVTRQQPLGGWERLLGRLIITGFDVDRHDALLIDRARFGDTQEAPPALTLVFG